MLMGHKVAHRLVPSGRDWHSVAPRGISSPMDVRGRFVAWRESLGLNQSELARLLECSQSQVHRIESGARTPGRRLANAIERATHALLGGPIKASDWDALEIAERAGATAAE